jgi:hypothetical protein
VIEDARHGKPPPRYELDDRLCFRKREVQVVWWRDGLQRTDLRRMFCRGEGADSARDLLRKSAVQLGEARVVLVQEELHDPVSIGSELGRLGEAAERVDVIGVLLAQELEERGAIVTRPSAATKERATTRLMSAVTS